MNFRVGLYYLFAALVIAWLGYAMLPFGIIILWPALSLLVVCLGYIGLGPRIYGKRNGQIPLWSRFLHYFFFLGQELSRRHYARNCRAWDEAVPGLLFGRKLTETEADELQAAGITAVVDLTAEFEEVPVLRNLHYLNIPLLDLTAPSEEQIAEAIEFIAASIETGHVYVHCKIGYSRTAAVVGRYLLDAGHASSTEEVVRRLREARPSIFLRPEAIATIEHG